MIKNEKKNYDNVPAYLSNIYIFFFKKRKFHYGVGNQTTCMPCNFFRSSHDNDN